MAEWHQLVVVLPGIGGTVLAEPDEHGQPGKVVWSANVPDVSLLVRPRSLELDRHPRLVPAGLIPTRRLFGLWTALSGYDGLLRRLGGIEGAVVDDGTPGRRNLHANVVAIGYDFRLGVKAAAEHLQEEVEPRLAALWPNGDHGSRVVVVAHSLGGLVARYWVARAGGAPVCRGLITLGTPHRGAPKALDVLVNGIPAGGLHLIGPRKVLREWPSLWELLPRYQAVRDLTVRPEPAVGPDANLRYPSELPLPDVAARAAAGMAIHQEIQQGWRDLEVPPDLVPRIGYGHGTLDRATWDGTHLKVGKSDPKEAPPTAPGGSLGAWAAHRGDGTVPTFCGLPIEMGNRPLPELGVPARHGQIADLPEVERLVRAYLGFPSVAPIRGEETSAWLGLDVAEVQVSGQVGELVVRPIGLTERDEVGLGEQQVIAGVYRLDPATGQRTGAPVWEAPLEWDAGLCRGVIPGLPAGGYELHVSADDLASGLSATQALEVVDNDID